MENILFFSELQHLALSLIIFVFLFWRFRDWRLFGLCLFVGVLIDFDHLIDYFLYNGFTFNLMDFLTVQRYMIPSGKIYVLFHGWEYLPVFWFLGKWLEKKFKIKGLVWSICLSYLGHLIIDNFSYIHHPMGYSVIYRLFNNFSIQSIAGGPI